VTVPGMLILEELRAEVDAGRIDTVLLAICDMQGRLQGKRLAARHFLDEVVEHNAEGCNYLLAVDVGMNTVDGYAMSSTSNTTSSRCCCAPGRASATNTLPGKPSPSQKTAATGRDKTTAAS
jgi:glutamine synthetase